VDYFDFISGEAKGNIWRFAAGCSVLMAFTFVSAPFFSVYMLERLNFNYWQYTAVIMSGQLTTYAFSGFWGRMADEHGSRNVMAVTAVVLPVVPLLWALFTDWYFLCLVEFIAGVSWAAYARGVSNFMYDSAAPSLRTKYLAFFGMTIGVAQFAGSIAGGLFYKHLPRFFPNAEPFVWLLIISMIGRMSAGFLFLKVKEPVNRSLGARGFLLKVFDLRSLLIQR
jgi:MFS family permease